jgi:tetratricopeptide (TPR) repeat protein
METNKDEMRRQYLNAKTEYNAEPSAYSHSRLFNTIMPYMKEAAAEANLDNFVRTVRQLEIYGYEKTPKYANRIVWAYVSLFSKMRSIGDISPEIFTDIFLYLQKLNYPKPSQEHSLILKFFLKRTDHYLVFSHFVKWWDIENLRPEDYEPEQWKEITYPALAETLYSQQAKYYLQKVQPNRKPDDKFTSEISVFITRLQQLLKQYTHFKFFPYYIAKLQLAIGQRETALENFLPFARNNTYHFWVWNFLSDFFTDDLAKQTALLCRAALCKAEEEKLLGVYVKMIHLFEKTAMYPEAHGLLQKVIEIRKKNNWGITHELTAMMNNPKIKDTPPSEALTQNFRLLSKSAEAVLFQNARAEEAVITRLLPERKLLFYVTQTLASGKFKRAVSYIKNPQPGMLVNIIFDDKIPVKVTLSESKENPELIKSASGKIKIFGQGTFGIVNDIYIPADKIENGNFKNGELLQVKAFRNYDKKKQKWGWMAYHLEKNSTPEFSKHLTK